MNKTAIKVVLCNDRNMILHDEFLNQAPLGPLNIKGLEH